MKGSDSTPGQAACPPGRGPGMPERHGTGSPSDIHAGHARRRNRGSTVPVLWVSAPGRVLRRGRPGSLARGCTEKRRVSGS